MDLHFTVSSLEADSADTLHIGISGSSLVVSGFSNGRKIVFEGDFGNVSFKMESMQSQPPDINPSVEEVCLEQDAGSPVDSVSIEVEKSPQSLFQRLSELRKIIALEQNAPAYVIFHDSSLNEMCQCLPSDLEAFSAIPGVGKSKLEKYGSRFIEVIREYVEAERREILEKVPV